MKFTVLVLEDEEYTRKYLVKLVEQHPGVGEVWGTGTGEEAIAIAAAHQPTLALLDVELGTSEQYNGIQVAQAIARVSQGTRYVFITGYAKYALDSFVVHPYDYLLKPVDRNRLRDTLQAIINLTNTPAASSPASSTSLVLRTKGRTDIIPYDDIIFLEYANRQTLIHTIDKTYTSYHPLYHFAKLLPPSVFLQLHKSYIVNKTRISSIREIGYRTYEVRFHNTDKTALMSRKQYLAHRHLLA